MSGHAYAKTDAGVPLYVVTERSWGQATEWLVAAPSLREAKASHGYTRQNYTTRSVRRARESDIGLPLR